MAVTNKNLYIALALFPCILWGLITLGCRVAIDYVNYPQYLSGYPIFRIMYFLRALVYLPVLMVIYKIFLPELHDTHQRIYIWYGILSLICILSGFFVKTKFWNYMLDGCLVSPFIEEIIARFILYEARNKRFKMYALVAIITSLSFGIMHFFYEPSTLIPSMILPKLSAHFVFGLMLCGVFWFLPRLGVLAIIHALSNLWSIVSEASELGFQW